ncbi:DEAD/DEAH box helicase family protein [Streptomyces sp. NPDC059104]|uniref:DEAD/DEAH box helicase family protein n=1 Tax=Streptomyces sp. NPDC059104 TaxID=3346729 RepID=UPI00368FD704
MQKTGEITLRPHQEEAVEAIVRGLDSPPGKRIPRAGLRATVVAACGTGKTFMPPQPPSASHGAGGSCCPPWTCSPRPSGSGAPPATPGPRSQSARWRTTPSSTA